jgi:glycosidase
VTELGGDTERAKVAAAIQLTLPGLPFVYYGEELGMTGPKPDELIRTPMAWTRAGPHAGFTTGTPWQPLAADSLQANVEAQRDDPRSLHRLYRRLIAMRATVPALAEGTLLPVRTNGPELLAYIRRAGDEAVLVVVNLDEMPITGLRLSVPAGTLAPRSYALRDLITEGDRVRWDGGGPPGGSVRGATLTVGTDGSFTDFAPIQSMPRKSVLVFSLTH